MPGQKFQFFNSKIRDVERDIICKVLQTCGGNIPRSAAVLKMGCQNLQYCIKCYQIDVRSLLQEQLKSFRL